MHLVGLPSSYFAHDARSQEPKDNSRMANNGDTDNQCMFAEPRVSCSVRCVRHKISNLFEFSVQHPVYDRWPCICSVTVRDTSPSNFQTIPSSFVFSAPTNVPVLSSSPLLLHITHCPCPASYSKGPGFKPQTADRLTGPFSPDMCRDSAWLLATVAFCYITCN